MIDPVAAAARPVRWQDAVVTDRRPRTPNITSFFLKPTQPFGWRPGQHVDVRLTAADGYRAIRSYSIASVPQDGDVVEIAVERLADGEVSAFLHDEVVVGDVLEVKGPLGGYFIWEAQNGGPVLLVGGGSGLVPLMAMVRHRSASGSDAPMQLLLSARTWADVLYREELEALAARDDGFGLTLSITREPPRRAGDFGRRVDAALVQAVIDRLPGWPRAVFICGTNGFVNAAADGAEAAGVAATVIRTERYGGA
jgi:ferredoxin-NADP reductase